MGDSKHFDEKRAETKKTHEQRLENEKEEARRRYQELLDNLKVINSENRDATFDIRPSKEEFESKYKEGTVDPLRIDFISKQTNATFTMESKFYPHAYVITVPDNATQKEKDIIRDLLFETIAHPINPPPNYKPKVVMCYSENTPKDQIMSDIEAAKKRGITVAAIFIGKEEELLKIDKAHREKTEQIKATGQLGNLPGYHGYVDMILASDGGRKGQEILRSYEERHDSRPSSPRR